MIAPEGASVPRTTAIAADGRSGSAKGAMTPRSNASADRKPDARTGASEVVERINLIVSEAARTVAMVELGFDPRSKLYDY